MSKVTSEDWGLVLRVGAAPSTLRGVRLDELGLKGVSQVPVDVHEGLWERLKPPYDPVREWARTMEGVIADLEEGLKQVQERCRGTLHVFPETTSPLAWLTGYRLEAVARQRPVELYQHDRGARTWAPFWSSTSSADNLKGIRYFGERQRIRTEAGGRGVVLALEGVQPINPSLLRDLAERNGAPHVYLLAPDVQPGDPRRVLRDTGTIGAALVAAERELRDLVARYPGAPLHIVSNLNVGLLIELGRRMPASVFGQMDGIYLHDFDVTTGRYTCALELLSGRPTPWVARDRLRIFERDGVIAYELDGRILPASRPALREEPPVGPRHEFFLDGSFLPTLKPKRVCVGRSVDRLTSNKGTFQKGVTPMNTLMLPASVKQALRGRTSLDVEIHALRGAALLDWEYLDLGEGGTPDWVGLREHWSLSRFPAELSPDHAPPLRMEEVRVLVVRALKEGDPVATAVDLDAMVAPLKAAGAKVERLDGRAPDLEQLVAVLKRFKPTLLVWLGHGLADGQDQWNRVLQTFDEEGQEIRLNRDVFSEALRGVRLVAMASCEVGAPAPAYGLAESLLRRDVEVVLAFRDQTYPSIVNAFFTAVFSRLVAGESVREAVRQGRYALFLSSKCQRYSGAFGLPALYARNPACLEPLVNTKRTDPQPAAPAEPTRVAPEERRSTTSDDDERRTHRIALSTRDKDKGGDGDEDDGPGEDGDDREPPIHLGDRDKDKGGDGDEDDGPGEDGDEGEPPIHLGDRDKDKGGDGPPRPGRR